EHAEEAFEWVPPDTTKELAVDYMRALPAEKLPIKGTFGAALRRQLLQKQLPLHDIDYKICDKLSDQEKKQFEKYLENIKKYVGQGTVTKILSARPFDGSLVTPVNATDMQQFSPQNKPNIQSNFVQLRTPSSFAPKSSYKKHLYENANTQEVYNSFETPSNCSNIQNIPILEKYNMISNDSRIVKSESIKNAPYNKGVHPIDFPKISSNNQNIAKEVPTTESLKPLYDAAVTRNPSECYKEAYKDMLKNPSTSLSHSKSISDNVYDAEAILADALLPPSIVNANDIIGTKQSDQNSPNIEYLKSTMKELTVDIAKSQKCHKCEEEIRAGDVAVITEKVKNAVWHPGCFVCNMCNELLVDLVYFYYKNKLYCGRDLATLLGIPRCFACDELIFVREYTVAEGHNYHVKHFCCWDCDVPLAGKQYTTENDRPLCLPCYQKTYAKTCNMCEKVIAADQQGVTVKDLNFHAIGTCFCCYICNKSLLDGRFAVREKKIFCSKECISKFLHPQT
ncbi:Prickle-like protein 2, partial [Habropoda laboriosa]